MNNDRNKNINGSDSCKLIAGNKIGNEMCANRNGVVAGITCIMAGNNDHEQIANNINNEKPADLKFDKFMRLALVEAAKAESIDEVPIGAIVVQNLGGESELIVAKAHNLKETTHNPAGHAEFLALQKAAQRLGRWRLSDCTVFVTLEPCVMCAGLMQQSRVALCVYGASDPKCGALASLYTINKDERLNHNFDVVQGVLESECSQILKDYFKRKRAKAHKS